jgi:SlyX protein
MSEETELQQRVTTLEIRLAHFEQMADELSEVIARQDHTIDIMGAKLQRLIERLRSVESGGGDRSPQDDRPPPHY